jgi:magnesium chelatase family protein
MSLAGAAIGAVAGPVCAAGERRHQLRVRVNRNFTIVGELALTSCVRPVNGVLPIALRAKADRKTDILVLVETAAEAAVVSGLNVIPVQNLCEAALFLEGEIRITPVRVDVAKIFDPP